jgi:glycosyltransferase involved in cell wall biosynthesis
MRVAIYHPWIYLKSGLERTLLELARRSRHEITLYTSHYDSAGTYPELADCRIVEVGHVSVRRAYAPVLAAAWQMARLRIDPDAHDALVISCDGLGDLLTLRNHSLPLLSLCFTPLRAVYDEEYRARHLQRMGWKRPLALAMEAGWRMIDRVCWRRYDSVLAISETVRARIAAGGLREADRVDVLRPGADVSHMTPGLESDPYFLVAGRVMWTKNIELALEAFALARPSLGPEWRLVIAGMIDAKSRDYAARLMARAEEIGGVELVEGPSDVAMRGYFARCTAFLFTPFNEDLGLVPIEAMASGKPIIAVNRGGPCETVLHGETGFLVPDTPQAFADSMIRLAQDPALARRLGAAGPAQAARFGWDQFVAGFDDAVDEAARQRRAR